MEVVSTLVYLMVTFMCTAPVRSSELYRCPSGLSGTMYTNNGQCYRFVDSPVTWDVADAVCSSSHGGHLVVILDQATMNFIMSTVVFSSTTYQVWIGFTDKDVEEQWKWVTGEAWAYDNWDSGYPEYCFGGNKVCPEDCAYFRTHDGKWREGHCNNAQVKYQYICQYDMGPTTTSTTTTPAPTTTTTAPTTTTTTPTTTTTTPTTTTTTPTTTTTTPTTTTTTPTTTTTTTPSTTTTPTTTTPTTTTTTPTTTTTTPTTTTTTPTTTTTTPTTTTTTPTTTTTTPTTTTTTPTTTTTTPTTTTMTTTTTTPTTTTTTPTTTTTTKTPTTTTTTPTTTTTTTTPITTTTTPTTTTTAKAPPTTILTIPTTTTPTTTTLSTTTLSIAGVIGQQTGQKALPEGIMVGLVVAIVLIVILIIIIIVFIARKRGKSRDRFEGLVQFDNRIYDRPWNPPPTNNGPNALLSRSTNAEPNPYDSLGPHALSTFRSTDNNRRDENHHNVNGAQGAEKQDENPYASLKHSDMLNYSKFVNLPKENLDSTENRYMHMRGSCSSDTSDQMTKDGTYVQMQLDQEIQKQDSCRSDQSLTDSDRTNDPMAYDNHGYTTHVSLPE